MSVFGVCLTSRGKRDLNKSQAKIKRNIFQKFHSHILCFGAARERERDTLPSTIPSNCFKMHDVTFCLHKKFILILESSFVSLLLRLAQMYAFWGSSTAHTLSSRINRRSPVWYSARAKIKCFLEPKSLIHSQCEAFIWINLRPFLLYSIYFDPRPIISCERTHFHLLWCSSLLLFGGNSSTSL